MSFSISTGNTVNISSSAAQSASVVGAMQGIQTLNDLYDVLARARAINPIRG